MVYWIFSRSLLDINGSENTKISHPTELACLHQSLIGYLNHHSNTHPPLYPGSFSKGEEPGYEVDTHPENPGCRQAPKCYSWQWWPRMLFPPQERKVRQRRLWNSGFRFLNIRAPKAVVLCRQLWSSYLILSINLISVFEPKASPNICGLGFLKKFTEGLLSFFSFFLTAGVLSISLFLSNLITSEKLDQGWRSHTSGMHPHEDWKSLGQKTVCSPGLLCAGASPCHRRAFLALQCWPQLL